MSEVRRIADQIASAYREGGWPGVSVRSLLGQLSPTEAASHPIPGAHSAWEIALHLAFWHDAVRRRIGGEVVEYAHDEDWPPPASITAENWKAALDRLDRTNDALVRTVEVMKPEGLSEMVRGRSFTVDFMLRGVPQHDLYHGGQVMMLIKAVRPNPER